jgi:hypothetical protein
MKKTAFALITLFTVAVLLSTACSSSTGGGETQLKTGSTQTQTLTIPLPPDPSKPTDITVRLAAAEVAVGGGATRLVDGTVQYNMSELQPSVNTSGSKVEITQASLPGSLPKDMVNKWNVKFNNTVLMNLTVAAGAYSGNWDLGGLRLQSLKWEEGASRSIITFDAANPDKMESFIFKTGASTVKLTNLANLNFGTMSFQGDAGSYTLDFGGKLKRSATADIKTAVSTVSIFVPVGTTAIINLKSKVSNIKTVGSWMTAGTTYTTGKEDAADKLTINIDIGAGQLMLDTH